MNDYARAHHLLPAAAFAVAVALVGWWLAGGTIALPQVVSGVAKPVQLQLMITVVLGPTTVWVFNAAATEFDRLGRRFLLSYDALSVATLAVPSGAVIGLMYLVGDGDHGSALARDGALYIGLALLCLGLFDETVALVAPIGYFMLVSTFGGTSRGTAYTWAYVRDDVRSWHLLLSTLVLIAGFTSFTVRQRRSVRPLLAVRSQT